MLFLTVYVSASRECDDVLDRLHQIASELKIKIRQVDITGIPDLEDKWGPQVPAGILRGKTVFKNGLDEPTLRTRIRMLTT